MARSSLVAGLAGLVLLFGARAGAEVLQADNATLGRLLAEGVPVIDIRTAGEWRETGTIAGTHRLTFFDEAGKYDVEAWLEQLGAVAEPGKPLVIMCQLGSRSRVVSSFLSQRLGYAQVYNVTRGIDAWVRAGRPVVRD